MLLSQLLPTKIRRRRFPKIERFCMDNWKCHDIHDLKGIPPGGIPHFQIDNYFVLWKKCVLDGYSNMMKMRDTTGWYPYSQHHSSVHQIILESPKQVFPMVMIWLAQLSMRSKKLAEINAPMDPWQVVAIIGRYPKRAQSRSFLMKH